MSPGDSVSGTVTLSNSSGEDAGVTLTQSIRSEVAGIGGGLLLDALQLEIRDSSTGSLVYLGLARGMGTAVLPDIANGLARSYSFTATLSPTASDSLQDASASLDYAWTATGRAPAATGGGGTVGAGGACALGKLGTQKADVLTGTASGDRLVGRAGNDRLSGLDGADCLFGGTGNDRMDGGAGDDKLLGGAGDDTVRARDGVAERIRCGSGRDTAIIDRIDRTASCERVLGR